MFCITRGSLYNLESIITVLFCFKKKYPTGVTLVLGLLSLLSSNL